MTVASLNEVLVLAGDIKNAYLQAPSSEKNYIIRGPEFGQENVGKKALITRALYGGKAAGRDFRNHLRSCMEHLGYTSCLADPDLWMRKAHRDKTGEAYWEYTLLYVDDALCVSEHPEAQLEELSKYFLLKPGSIQDHKADFMRI